MNDIVSPDEESIAPEHPLQLAVSPIRILLYSDDVNTREKVRLAVGPRSAGRPIEWVETATHEGTVMQADTESFDLMILDGEAAKSGGMGLARQFKHELFSCPPVVVLVGRMGDAWLATWSEAEAAVAHPLDPFEVKAAVDEFFTPASAQA
jgi:DNA-binding response OmpR family regulator